MSKSFPLSNTRLFLWRRLVLLRKGSIPILLPELCRDLSQMSTVGTWWLTGRKSSWKWEYLPKTAVLRSLWVLCYSTLTLQWFLKIYIQLFLRDPGSRDYSYRYTALWCYVPVSPEFGVAPALWILSFSGYKISLISVVYFYFVLFCCCC